MRTGPSQVSFWILLLAVILGLCSASPVSPSVDVESSLNYQDAEVVNDALSHIVFKRRLGVRLPNILRVGDHRVTKRRLGVRLPNILFSRDGTVMTKKADEDF